MLSATPERFISCGIKLLLYLKRTGFAPRFSMKSSFVSFFLAFWCLSDVRQLLGADALSYSRNSQRSALEPAEAALSLQITLLEDTCTLMPNIVTETSGHSFFFSKSKTFVGATNSTIFGL